MKISNLTPAIHAYPSLASTNRTSAPSPEGSTGSASPSQAKLTPDEQQQVQKLKERDRQVRQHEQAHMSAGAGVVTSSPSFTYQKGPDGVNYAIGGEVGISTSPGRTPDETIARAEKIRTAALAPADPSGQDRAVAAQASQMAQQAQIEKSQQSAAESKTDVAPKTQAINRTYDTPGETAKSRLSIYA